MPYVSLGTPAKNSASVVLLAMRTFLLALAVALSPVFAADANAPVQPAAVCEVLAHPANYAGRTVLVVGRFSFREYGRFLSEKDCVLRVVLDEKDGPVPPSGFAVNNDAAARTLATIRKTTSLAKFRFGSAEYDRWAMIYGLVEPASPPEKRGAREFDDAASRILCHSDTLIVFLREP